MGELEKPDLNRMESITCDYILPALPSNFREPDDLDEEEVKIARSILAKQYVEKANLKVLWKTALILLVYDLLFVFEAQIYGLVLSMLGSLSLALPTLHTPETLLEGVINKPEELLEEVRFRAEQSVKTNVGVFALMVGFAWQVLTVSGTIPSEILGRNYLVGEIPGWLGFVLVFIMGLLILKE
jgi:hypothetical protein